MFEWNKHTHTHTHYCNGTNNGRHICLTNINPSINIIIIDRMDHLQIVEIGYFSCFFSAYPMSIEMLNNSMSYYQHRSMLNVSIPVRIQLMTLNILSHTIQSIQSYWFLSHNTQVHCENKRKKWINRILNCSNL